MMTAAEIEMHFTAPDGGYVFARWGRPIVPVVFGVADETLTVIKGAIEAVVTLAGHNMAETDAELGANLMFFFFKDWQELLDVPKLGEMIPNLDALVLKLQLADASQYRSFRFDDAGGIQACFVFLRMKGELAQMPAETLALGQSVQAILRWSDAAFSKCSPLAVLPEKQIVVLRPEIGAVIRAAYEASMPVCAVDKSHALRIFARIQACENKKV